jgi:DNA repair exonuclease SbcCD ATPase subunit
VLSVGQETSHLREMIEIQRARSVRDQQTVRDGEREITTLETRAAHLASVDDIVVIVDRAETLFNEAEDGRRKGERLNGLLQSIEETAALIEKAKARKVILDSIPSEADRDRLVSEIMKSAARSDLLQRIETASREVTAARSRLAILAKLPDPPVLTPSDRIATLVDAAEMAGSNLAWLRKRLEILATIPDAPPVLESSDRVIEIGVAIRKAQDALTPAKARLAEIDGEIKEVEKNTAALLAEMGNLCPTCGQTVDDGAAFLHHGHHADGSSPEDRT